jgi:hypothetical protein
MLSIENFYYVLYHYLLEPLSLQDTVYETFGSVNANDILRGRYKGTYNRYGLALTAVHSCYFHDQEPIQTANFLDLIYLTTSKHCKILANSEISDLKKHLCRNHGSQDWYYFFHGFAALDWYRDGRYFDYEVNWSRPYITMNRLHVNDRSYRLNLIARLAAQGILNQGYVSLHLENTQYGSWRDELNSINTKLSSESIELIQQHIDQQLIIDKEDVASTASADFGNQEFNLWKSGLWHIVTETVFYYDKLHLTEKIFKPIVAKRPFMLAAAPGNLAYLKSYGFETFDQWIDESYDTITDHDKRLQAIVEQTKRLCSMSNEDLQDMHREMMPVLEHNFQHFYGNFKQKIVNELVDNFETAVRVWNNGRVDGRNLPLHKIDFAAVKKILSR